MPDLEGASQADVAARQPDGKVVVGGSIERDDGHFGFLLRLNAPSAVAPPGRTGAALNSARTPATTGGGG